MAVGCQQSVQFPPVNDERLRTIGKANSLPLDVILRLAYVSSVEERSVRSRGRHTTTAELERALRRYPWTEPPPPVTGGGSAP